VWYPEGDRPSAELTGTRLQHLKDLEDRVFSLEQTTTDQGSENNALKQLLVQ
jgi:hypothetical protein